MTEADRKLILELIAKAREAMADALIEPKNAKRYYGAALSLLNGAREILARYA